MMPIHEGNHPAMALLSCIPLFMLIYALAYFFIFPSWKHKARFEAASCTMSLVHGSLTAIFSANELLHNPWQLDAPNTPSQNLIMEFSMAYFIVDLLHYLLFVPEDYKFVLHHLATSIYMASCRFFARRGALSVMALMGLGEVTTPLQSVWAIARMGRAASPVARSVYELASLPFTLLFTFTRGVVGPFLAWKLCQFYLSNQAHGVPFWLAALWMAMVLLGLAGSLMWMQSLWVGLRKFNARKKLVAVRGVAKAE